MTRILLVESASPRRVRHKAEQLLTDTRFPSPEVTILCKDDAATAEYYREISHVRVIPLCARRRSATMAGLRRERFDVTLAFWTGEKKYRRMKWRCLRLGSRATYIDAGDGAFFRLTWKAALRTWLFRLQHPLPTDHWSFVGPRQAPDATARYPGEKVLVIQSAEPVNVLTGLEHAWTTRLFDSPRFTVFCRNRGEIIESLRSHPRIAEIRTHTETKGVWKHLARLRSERFDAVMVFFTGDPSYWKIKCFAFLLGAKHKVVFNENNDCFYFSLRTWLWHLSYRLGERSRTLSQPRWMPRAGVLLFLLLKVVILPFRFTWLLLVWLRLRSAGWKANSCHDCEV